MTDTPVAGGGTPLVTFKELVLNRKDVVSPTPHMKIHHESGVCSLETSDKERESEMEIQIRHSQPKLRGIEGGAWPETMHPHMRTKETLTMSHSLKLAVEECKKIREPKVSKLKGGYTENAMLVFNFWLKNIEMWIKECKLLNLEAVQLVEDYTSNNVRGAVEFYLDTNSTGDVRN